MIGISESARTNAVIVIVKVSIVIIVIAFGFSYIKPHELHTVHSAQHGQVRRIRLQRDPARGGVIFFAYIGFDAVSTAAQEAKNPQRDMPIGIIGSLVVCTILYVLFAHVLTGMVNYTHVPWRRGAGGRR